MSDNSAKYISAKAVPDWAEPTISKLVDKGYLIPKSDGFVFSETMARLIVLHDENGLYGE